jgi:tripartite-type tricarboxylate transporter receptor subunit TctC
MTIHRRFLGAVGALCVALGVAPALAEYPEKPIRVIYPYAAGGAGDALARLFATAAGPVLGQQLVVENRPGAGGNIGFAAGAQAAPDGYTLLSVSPAFAINATLYTTPGYDPVKDFVPVAPLSIVPNVLIVNAASSYKSLKDLVDYARANPGKLSFGSSGIGTSIHLASELLKQQARIDMVHIPYTGAAQAAVDLLGGRIDLMFDSAPTALVNVSGGRARALTIAATSRLDQMKDVPTTAEAGYPELLSGAWTGMVAPANTPKPIVDKLTAIFDKVTRDPAVLEFLATKLGGKPFYGTPAEFGVFVKREVEVNGELVKALKLRVE